MRVKQIQRLVEIKTRRDNGVVAERLGAIRRAAQSRENVIPHILSAVESYATVGEISDVLRKVWGEYEG